ncbi:MAG: tetratricopeptide repeat protein [Candidatus Zapsychrus exili]|nr:tetratricopeptide repeat protein [Candidatus Zapsychrus exili]
MSDWFFKKISFFVGLLAILLLFGLIVFEANIEIKDMDLWLHLSSGKHIVENLSIPKVDIFSCSIAGKPWVNHEWLFQTVLHFAHGLGGIDGLINLQVIVVVLTFTFLLLLGYNRDKQFLPTFFLLLVLLVYETRLTIRPDIFSFLFFVLYVCILSSSLGKKSSLFILVIIQILWSNIHGFFILGPAIVLLAIVSEFIKRRVKLPFEWNNIGRLDDDEYNLLKKIFLAVYLACLINPYGIKGALYPFGILSSVPGESKIFFESIRELARPILLSNIFSLRSYPFFKMTIVLSALSFVYNRRKIDITVLFMWIIFLVISLSAIRNLVFFAIMAYFAFLANTHDLTFNILFPALKRNDKFKEILIIILKVSLIFWIMLYFQTLSLRGYFDFDKYQRKSEFGGVSLRIFPTKAVDFLKKNNIKGNFFNDFNAGAYLIGRVYPNIKVFIDGRTEMYGTEFFKEYRDVKRGDGELFDQLVEKHSITGVFFTWIYDPVPEKILYYIYKSEDWVLVYFDYDGAVFLKDIEENKEWIKVHKIDLSKANTEPADLIRLGAKNVTPFRYVNRAAAYYGLKLYDHTRSEIKEALRIEPRYSAAYKLLGKIDLKENKLQSAFENLRKAKLLNVNSREIRYYLALCFYKLDKIEEAKKQCQIVLDSNPKNAKGLFLRALLYIKEKEYEKAYETFKEAYDITSRMIDEMVEVADLFLENGEISYAKEIYNLIIESDSDNIDVVKKLEEIKNNE